MPTPQTQSQPYYPGPYPMQPFIYQPNTNNLTITMQPAGACAPTPAVAAGATGTARPPVQYEGYLCWSIFSMLCCCCPLGLAAIIYACKAQSASHARDERASSHSRIARNLNIAALVLGLLIEIVVPVVVVVIFVTGNGFNSKYNSRY
ncbi:hypothetical protein AB205_0103240 [Aquarana catesbeiana]|uniref:Proline-rich transmembrane protein 1 n=2 Tax=Aquarana catesbeiana TaxID=8400 RepID=A0A2G9RY62_AQUCT|nr:hypothetical protein AB205_0103240 [Aquarana catesbeiana]